MKSKEQTKNSRWGSQRCEENAIIVDLLHLEGAETSFSEPRIIDPNAKEAKH